MDSLKDNNQEKELEKSLKQLLMNENALKELPYSDCKNFKNVHDDFLRSQDLPNSSLMKGLQDAQELSLRRMGLPDSSLIKSLQGTHEAALNYMGLADSSLMKSIQNAHKDILNSTGLPGPSLMKSLQGTHEASLNRMGFYNIDWQGIERGLKSAIIGIKIYSSPIIEYTQQFVNAMQPIFLTINNITKNPVFQENMRTVGQIAHKWHNAFQQIASSQEFLQVSKTIASLQPALSTFAANIHDINQTCTRLNQQMEPIFTLYPKLEQEREDISDFFKDYPVEESRAIPLEPLWETGVLMEQAQILITQHIEKLGSDTEIKSDGEGTFSWKISVEQQDVNIMALATFLIFLTSYDIDIALSLLRTLVIFVYDSVVKYGNDPFVTGMGSIVEVFGILVVIWRCLFGQAKNNIRDNDDNKPTDE